MQENSKFVIDNASGTLTDKPHSQITIYLLQTAAGTVGVLFLTFVLELWISVTEKLLFGSEVPDSRNIGFYTMLIFVGLGTGYLVNGRLASRWGKWIWIVALVWWLILTSDWWLRGEPGNVIAHNMWLNVFSSQCDSSECLYELAGTFPLVGSIGYSIGAWLVFRRRAGRE